jgi:hypothetical protein
MPHEAALAAGKLTRVWHRRSAYPSEVIMSRRLLNLLGVFDIMPSDEL